MGKRKLKTKKLGYEWDANASRIIPLQDNHCYIHDAQGKLHHVKRNSDEFNELISKLREDIGEERTDRELEKLQ